MNLKALNLNSRGIANDSPLNAPDQTIGLAFEMQNEVQMRKMRSSAINLVNFVQTSNVDQFNFPIGAGSTVTVHAALTPTTNPSYPNFGLPFVTLYKGTAANGDFAIFPFNGSSTNVTDYAIIAGLDWEFWEGADKTSYAIQITNNSGALGTITYVSQFKVLNYNQQQQG